MGCTQSRKENKISFEEQEIIKLKRLFDRLKNRYSETEATDHICIESLEYLFDGRPELGGKLYRFIAKHSTNNNIVDYDNFIQILEILIKEPSAFHLQNYRVFDKMEILFLISLERLDVTSENFKESKVSFLESLTFLQDVEYICIKTGLSLSQRVEKDESTARTLLESVYPTSSGSVPWWSLVLFFKQVLPHLSDQIKTFFIQLFLTTSQPKIQSRFIKPSYLLTNQQFIYLALGNMYLQTASSVGLLWSNAHFGWDFKSLYDTLTNFDHPTIFLMRFEDTNNPAKNSICGAFNKRKWLDQGSFQGDDECYLFQLTPKFKIFSAQRFRRQFPNENDVDAQNYCYLHFFDDYEIEDKEKDKLNKIVPSGLGFGGGMPTSFRLWIDYLDMQKDSYVNNQNDRTFRLGSLIDPILIGEENFPNLNPPTNGSSKNYKLGYMEIWGIGKENDILSTQLMVEKANHLESQYLRNSMKVHKQVVQQMKINSGGDQELETKSPEKVEQLTNEEQYRSSRKNKMMDLLDSKQAGKAYVPVQTTITQWTIAKTNRTTKYITPNKDDIQPVIVNEKTSVSKVQFADTPEPVGFRNTRLMQEIPLDDESEQNENSKFVSSQFNYGKK